MFAIELKTITIIFFITINSFTLWDGIAITRTPRNNYNTKYGMKKWENL